MRVCACDERIEDGVAVRHIDPSGPAAQAGLRESDVICEINRKSVASVEEFQRPVGKLKAKDRVVLLISRDRATIYLAINPE